MSVDLSSLESDPWSRVLEFEKPWSFSRPSEAPEVSLGTKDTCSEFLEGSPRRSQTSIYFPSVPDRSEHPRSGPSGLTYYDRSRVSPSHRSILKVENGRHTETLLVIGRDSR